MSEQRYKELTCHVSSLKGLSLDDFTSFSQNRAENILASTSLSLHQQAEILKLHTIQQQTKGEVCHHPEPFTHYPEEAIGSFESMQLKEEIRKGIHSYGIECPSAVQQCGIKPIQQGKDVVLQAPVGTGKTVALCIGMLERVDPAHHAVQALVVCPSHEEAEHTDALLSHVGELMAEGNTWFSATFFGRTRMRQDDQKLDKGVIIAAGTPVRLLDLIRRGSLKVNELKFIAFDNVDDLLYDFSREVYALARVVPRDIQFVMTSTILPPDATDFAHWFLKDPKRVMVRETAIPEGVKQYAVQVPDSNDARLDRLKEILKCAGDTQTMAFCNTRWKTTWVAEKLQSQGYSVSCVHADRLRQDRDHDLEAFKYGKNRILVITERLAAGVDPQQAVKLVINFDLPLNEDSYLLRIGRVGRFGRKAVVINFENPGEVGTLGWFETQ
eukprot:GGOE01002183.1.p1 GENE.GGOE01002183.1~~GGOE01002183.1.p1  ORF type:complete len:441 (+),score=37.02 GGOE01002183.1:54-1376(+)